MRKQIFARARWWAILTSDPDTREECARFQGVLVELKKGEAMRSGRLSRAPRERQVNAAGFWLFVKSGRLSCLYLVLA